LWGLRTRSRLLHDGSALTLQDAINRHRGESGDSARRIGGLPQQAKDQLLSFLKSL
jgi:CxxC motif-containing protein (DUF1111 family)